MTGEQSRQLKVGEKICWQNDQADRGTATETSWSGLTIKWDGRGEQRVLHNDMSQIDRVRPYGTSLEPFDRSICFGPSGACIMAVSASHRQYRGYNAEASPRLKRHDQGRDAVTIRTSDTVRLPRKQ
jgi:hypothetical protein